MEKVVEKKIEGLISWFRRYGGPVVVAFSGGVDSSVVLALAVRALGVDKVIAVTFTSPMYPEEDLTWAVKIAKLLGVRHLILSVDQLDDPYFRRNPPDRCYYCKRYLAKRLKEVASGYGAHVVVDGTNATDFTQYRPGIQALIEYGVKCPLAELGISKNEVRLIAKVLGLPNWDKPSSACLVTRIPYGCEVTLEKLRRIALAERIVKEIVGVKQVRVRDHDYIARIEVGRDERVKFFNEELMDRVATELMKLGYKYVTLDLLGYRTGSLDEILK